MPFQFILSLFKKNCSGGGMRLLNQGTEGKEMLQLSLGVCLGQFSHYLTLLPVETRPM